MNCFPGNAKKVNEAEESPVVDEDFLWSLCSVEALRKGRKAVRMNREYL